MDMRGGALATAVVLVACGQELTQDGCLRLSGVVQAAMQEEREQCRDRIDPKANEWDVDALDRCLEHCDEILASLDAAKSACAGDESTLSVIAETRVMVVGQRREYALMKGVQGGTATRQQLLEALSQAPRASSDP